MKRTKKSHQNLLLEIDLIDLRGCWGQFYSNDLCDLKGQWKWDIFEFFQTLWCEPTSKLLNSLASDPLKSWVSCWHFWNGKSMMKMSFASALEELEWFFDFPFSWMKTSAAAARFCTARTTMQNSISADAPFSPVVLFTKRFCLWFIACFWRRVFFHWKERRTKINCFENLAFCDLGGQN